MNPTKTNAIKAAAERGCTLIKSDETVTLIAPHGHVLGNGSHLIDIYYRRGWTMPEVWENVLNELSEPMQKCEDKDCEFCASGNVLPYGEMARDVLTGRRTEMKE